MKKLILVMIAGLSLFQCGRPPVIWQTWLDTGADEECVKIINAGEYLVLVANRIEPGTGRTAGIIQLIEPDGRLRNRINVTEGSYTLLRDAALDKQKNLYLCGLARLQDTTICLIIRLGSEGRIRWKKGVVLGEGSWGNGICPVENGIALTGGVNTAEGNRLLIAVLDTSGATRWSRTCSLAEPAEGWKLRADAEGNLTVLGRFCAGPDLLLVRFDPDGDTIWTRRYDSGGRDEPGNLALDLFGNIIAVGTARIGDSTRCVILEYTADGGVVRKVAYGEQAQAEGADVGISPDGTVIIAGTLFSPKSQRPIAFEYLPNASSIWERQLDLGRQGRGVAVAVDGGLLLGADAVRKNRDAVLLRLDWQPRR